MSPLSKASAWHGVWTALVTPLTRRGEAAALSRGEDLQLDEEGLQKLIEGQLASGVTGLVIAGSTGEGSLLPEALLQRLLVRAREIVKGRVPLVAGLGIGGTDASLRAAEQAGKLGYDGVLASPPAYIRAPQRGLRDHYLALAAVGLPLCIYEIPGRAASSIAVETLRELADAPSPHARNLIAVKDATGQMQRIVDERRFLGERFALLSGDDGTFADFVYNGGHGVISVVSHIVPCSMAFILKGGLRGRTGDADAAVRARNEQLRINPLIDALFSESNPVPVKSLLAAQGLLRSPVFCAPLCPMQADLLSKLKQLATEIGDHS